MAAYCVEAPEYTGEMKKQSPSTLRNDFAWTFAGNSIYAACQWAVLVLLAKIGSPELVGRYAFAVAVATPVITFANLQLRSVQVTDVSERYRFGDYLSLRLWTMIGALAVLVGSCLATNHKRDSAMLIAVIGVSLAIEAVSETYYGFLQIHHRMDRIAKSMIIRGCVSLAAIGATIWFTRSLLMGAIALVAARLAVTFAYDMQFALRGLGHRNELDGPRWSVRNQLELLRIAFPVGLVAVLVSLNTSLPRYFLEWSFGPRELGIFSALSFFQSSGNMVVGALGQSAFRRLAAAYARLNLRHFARLLGTLLVIGIGLGAGGVLITLFAGRPLLAAIYRPEYAERADLLVMLMVAAGFGYLGQLLGTAMTAARIFHPQIPLFLIVAATLTLASYLLVPHRGVAGAILAILITAVVQLLGCVFFLVRDVVRQRHLQPALSGTSRL